VLGVLAFAAAIGQSQGAMPTVSAAEGIVLARQIASESPSGDTVILKLPQGVAEIELNETKQRELLRAAFPGGSFTLRQQGAVRILRRADNQAARMAGTCFVARTDIAEGTTIEEEDLAPAECRREGPGRWLGHEAASRTIYARRGMAAGTYLGAVRVGRSAAARAGAELVFRTSEGPVTVERQVVALQPGQPGRDIFVRTDEGTVLVSRLEEEAAR
jgi:flagella basal body P-ring formation protein FlgA